jgi:RNA-directed DNA polymerase
MLAALENGVKGGKWFSLMDKVWRPSTLDQAWRRVKRNRGAAGVDRLSTERFELEAEKYLQEFEGSAHRTLQAASGTPSIYPERRG